MNTVNQKRHKLNKEFYEWWDKEGYKYVPENDEEADWLIVVKYWAWKAWESKHNKENKMVTYLEAVKALESGECDEIMNEVASVFVLDEEGNIIRKDQPKKGILMTPFFYLGKWCYESKIKPEDNKIFSGKNSEKLWSEINNLTYNPIKDILYSLGCKLQEVEDKIDEGGLI